MYYVSYLQQKTSQVAVTFYQKIPFFRSSIDLGKPSDCSSFISSSLVAFFSSFVEDSFCGTSKKGEQTNKPMKLGFAPGKMKFPLIIQVRSCEKQEKNGREKVPRLRKLRITPMLKVDLMTNDPLSPQNHRDNVAMIERRTSSQVATK